MSETVNKTQEHVENIFNQVRQYMPEVGKRIFFNYGLLFGVAFLISILVPPFLAQYIPRSTANTIGFGLTVLWLFYGWRLLEKRNRATSLYALYVRFSKERRDLEQTLTTEKTKTEEVSEQVEVVEATAESFILAAQEQNIEPRQLAK
jgi:hypothetical protein